MLYVHLLHICIFLNLSGCSVTGSQLTKSCSSIDDDDKLDCGFIGIEQSGCVARNCRWCPSRRNGVPWCFAIKKQNYNCSEFINHTKIDCHSESNPSRGICEARQCLWCESEHPGIPWCFHKAEVTRTTNAVPTISGTNPNRTKRYELFGTGTSRAKTTSVHSSKTKKTITTEHYGSGIGATKHGNSTFVQRNIPPTKRSDGVSQSISTYSTSHRTTSSKTDLTGVPYGSQTLTSTIIVLSVTLAFALLGFLTTLAFYFYTRRFKSKFRVNYFHEYENEAFEDGSTTPKPKQEKSYSDHTPSIIL